MISRRLSKAQFTPMPKLQVLIYPGVQKLTSDLPSYQYNRHGPIVTKELASYFLSWYVFGNKEYRKYIFNNTHVSPEYRKSYKHIFDISLLPNDAIMKAYKASVPQESTIWRNVREKFQNPDLWPLITAEEDLKHLPPAYISTCQYDILRDEGIFYVNRLRKAGVNVIHNHLTACFHGWTFSHENSFIEEYSDIISFVDKKL